MASENETVEDIVKELRDQYEDATDICVIDAPEYADRIESAHRREVAELRKCLKEAYGLQLRCDSCKIRKCDSICVMKLKWRKALEGANGGAKPL